MDICLDSTNPALSDRKLVPDAGEGVSQPDEADEEVKAVFSDPWKDKAKVFEQVNQKVDRIMDFR